MGDNNENLIKFDKKACTIYIYIYETKGYDLLFLFILLAFFFYCFYSSQWEDPKHVKNKFGKKIHQRPKNKKKVNWKFSSPLGISVQKIVFS